MSPNPLDIPLEKKFKPSSELEPQEAIQQGTFMLSQDPEPAPQDPQEPATFIEPSLGANECLLLKTAGEEFGIRFEPYEFPAPFGQFDYSPQQNSISNVYIEPWDSQCKSIVWPYKPAEHEYQVIPPDAIEPDASGSGLLQYCTEPIPSTSVGLSFQTANDTALQNRSISLKPEGYLPNPGEVYYQPHSEELRCNNPYNNFWPNIDADTVWPYQPGGPDISYYPMIEPNHDQGILGIPLTPYLTTPPQPLGGGSELSNNISQQLYVDTGVENMAIPLELEPSTSQIGVQPTQYNKSAYSEFWDNAYKELIWPFQSTSNEVPSYPVSPGPSKSCSEDYAYPDMFAIKTEHSESDEESIEEKVDVSRTFDDASPNADIDVVTVSASIKQEQPTYPTDSPGPSENTRQDSIFYECLPHRIEFVPSYNNPTTSNNEPPLHLAPVCLCQCANLRRSAEHNTNIAMQPEIIVPVSSSIQLLENFTAHMITFTTLLNLQIRNPEP